MPSYQTNGIVIGRTNFGEADRIVRLLTPEHGKVSAVAKGVRKIKSRLAGHLEPFAETTLTLTTGRNLDLIISARLSWYPHQLIADFGRISLANTFVTLIDKVAQDRHAQPELFAHLAEALRVIDLGETGPLTDVWFKLRLLNLAGFRPGLGACVTCGTTNPAERFLLSIHRGGIVCWRDAEPTDEPLSLGAIKLWRLLCDYHYATIARINGANAIAETTSRLCDTFCAYHLGGGEMRS
jgi:DNA repair protein RecO (recombination protein O)